MDSGALSTARITPRRPLGASVFSPKALGGTPEICGYRFKYLLRRIGLTMTGVSALTANRYGKASHFFVPPAFLYRYKCGITPHICQILALSQVTGYRFTDWMRLFGFDLDLIFPLQLRIHTERTVIVTPGRSAVPSGCAVSNTAAVRNKSFWFVKIGSHDAVVYPFLQPGSVVRVDRSYCSRSFFESRPHDTLLWLVEHPAGLTCCHVKAVDSEHVMLLPNRPPLTGWPLCVSREVQILGLVDLELWPRDGALRPPIWRTASREPSGTLMPDKGSRTSLSTLLQRSRKRSGLTLRAAHEMSLQVAQLLGDSEYAIALSLLSDYEAMNKLPRHVAKIMTLCVIYGIEIRQLIAAAGVHIDDSGEEPLPAMEQTDFALNA